MNHRRASVFLLYANCSQREQFPIPHIFSFCKKDSQKIPQAGLSQVLLDKYRLFILYYKMNRYAAEFLFYACIKTISAFGVGIGQNRTEKLFYQ